MPLSFRYILRCTQQQLYHIFQIAGETHPTARKIRLPLQGCSERFRHSSMPGFQLIKTILSVMTFMASLPPLNSPSTLKHQLLHQYQSNSPSAVSNVTPCQTPYQTVHATMLREPQYAICL